MAPNSDHKTLFASLRELFNLRSDTDQDRTIEEIRRNINFSKANGWTLVFAILIASVGLNTNSTAVIIGAMLISPLMGPIVGAGLALGTNDFELLRRSVRNLGFAVLISVLASALYFLLSPFSEAQSELLARTRPTVYDVLIAIFGGATGIIAISRTEKGNAVPGVAIATALMPPLCTAGYGLATGNLQYFLGAFYLFLINTMFICLSTVFFVRYLGFPIVTELDKKKQVKVNRLTYAAAAVVFLPSVFLGWLVIRESGFNTRMERFLRNEMNFADTYVLKKDIEYSFKQPKVTVALVGQSLDQSKIQELKRRLALYDLENVDLSIRQSSFAEDIERRLNERLTSAQQEKEKVSAAELRLKLLEQTLDKYRTAAKLGVQLRKEVSPLLPKVESVYMAHLTDSGAAETAAEKSTVLVQWKSAPTKKEREQLSTYLKERLQDPAVEVREVSGISGDSKSL